MTQPSALITLFDEWGSARGLPPGLGVHLLEACPWLDGQETMSPELAPQLLEEAIAPYGLTEKAVESLCTAYNEYVDRDYLASVPARNSAYTAIAELLEQHGSLGVGETYWLVEDSFSTSTPVIVVKDPSALSSELMKAVTIEVARCPQFTNVVFSDEDGNNAVELSAR